MQLDEGIYEPTLIKEDLLTYCQELTKALEIHAKLIEQSFHSAFPGDEDLQHHDLQLSDYIYWK